MKTSPFLNLFTIFLLISAISVLNTTYAKETIRLQPPEEIVETVESFLHQYADATYPGTATIHVPPPTIRNQPHCNQLQAHLPSGAKLRPSLMVTVQCQAPEAWTLRVKAELSIEGYYYTANRTLEVGEVLQLDDLAPIKGELLRLPQSVALDPSHIIDHITKQRIQAGSTIRTNSLRNPQAIERGQTVRTLVEGEGFSVSGEATALQDGNPGAQIQLRVRSGKTIQGTVLDKQTVRIF